MRLPARSSRDGANVDASLSSGSALSPSSRAKVEPREQRLLRERLYQRSASDTDLVAYRTALEGVIDEPVAGPPARRGAVPWASFGRLALIGGLAVVLLLGAVTAVDVVRPAPSRVTTAATPPLVPSSLLDPREERAVRAALIAHRDRPDDVLMGLATGTRLWSSSSPALSADSAALSGVAAGRTTVPLGPLGTTAGGHAVTVVVATLNGRYGWRLTAGGGRQARETLASTSATGAGVVSSTAVAVPLGEHELTLVFEVPAATRFAYSVLLSD